MDRAGNYISMMDFVGGGDGWGDLRDMIATTI